MRYGFVVAGLALVVLAIFLPTALAQKVTDQWLRVITGEESIIDVDRRSLILEPNSTIRAKFRTTLATEESVPGKSDVKYLTRIDQIQFDLAKNKYRIQESEFLNVKSEHVSSVSAPGDDGWKLMTGDAAYKLRRAAAQLAPLGIWKVSSYQYPLGDLPSDKDPPEVKTLVGSEISISVYEILLAPTKCAVREFEPMVVTDEQFIKMFGSPLTALGISASKVNGILFKCAGADKTSVSALMLRMSADKALFFWDGVFLNIERRGNPFLPY